ncbi:MAG: response regulator transcription factor [Cyclobacteriaceae bacterium]
MKAKILYVEDEPFLGRIVKESLESRDFAVTMINDGANVMTALQKSDPDLCVLDVMLPGKDGYSIAEEIRKLRQDMPIIFVSAKVQTEDVLKGFHVGGNDYLRKPFSMEELIVRVNNLLKTPRSGKTTQEKIKLGRYEFYPGKYELKLAHQTRRLSHRESTLLLMLAENINAATQRKEILLKIWGDDSFFNSRNLDVYISKLRDYLREDPTIQIVTIKGVGYHFIVE